MAHTPKHSKTRLLIMDVARKLFAQYGKDSVTMNDIANHCSKGRRTIYTYFSNKDEIYLAVIQSELEIIIERLALVAESDTNPKDKLELYVKTRFDAFKEVVLRNGTLKADFFRNVYEVEKARRRIDIREVRMLRAILTEGKEQGVFQFDSAEWSSILFLYALKGLETAYMNKNIGEYMRTHYHQIMKAVFNGLTPRD